MRWRRHPRAVLTRPAPPPDMVLRYGSGDDHVADLRLPADTGGSTGAPLVVVVHGGFWRAAFDRSHTGPMCADLASRGYAVAAIEYRRVGQPGGGWPGTFDDVANALDALPGLVREAAPSTDPGRVVLVGHSAGGHLALWSVGRHRLPASSPWHRAEPLPVAGVVSLAGVCDLTQASRLGLGDGAVDALLGGPADTVPDRIAATSPAWMLPLGARLALVHGDRDAQVPVQVSRDFAAAATDAGDEVRLFELPGVEHFGLIDPRSSAWPHVLEALDALAD